jgi:hypothetical protein
MEKQATHLHFLSDPDYNFLTMDSGDKFLSHACKEAPGTNGVWCKNKHVKIPPQGREKEEFWVMAESLYFPPSPQKYWGRLPKTYFVKALNGSLRLKR